MARSGWLEYGGAEKDRTEVGLDAEGRKRRSLRRIGGVRDCDGLGPAVVEEAAAGGGGGRGGGGGGAEVEIKDACDSLGFW